MTIIDLAVRRFSPQLVAAVRNSMILLNDVDWERNFLRACERAQEAA